MYAITIHVGTITRDGTGSVAVPTFFLEEGVQGITGPGMACEIARQIVDPVGHMSPDQLHIHAAWVPIRVSTQNEAGAT